VIIHTLVFWDMIQRNLEAGNNVSEGNSATVLVSPCDTVCIKARQPKCTLLVYYAALSGSSAPTFRELDFLTLEYGTGCTETSKQNYHPTLRNIREQHRAHLHGGRKLKSRNPHVALCSCRSPRTHAINVPQHKRIDNPFLSVSLPFTHTAIVSSQSTWRFTTIWTQWESRCSRNKIWGNTPRLL
jgi:hypothetical protein